MSAATHPGEASSTSSFGEDAEGWNLTRFDARTLDPKKGHLESTFLKFNDPSSPRALWVKLTVFAPTARTSGGPAHERGRTVAEAWAIAFDRVGSDDAAPPSYRETPERGGAPGKSGPKPLHVAVKQTVPIEEATLASRRPFALAVAGVRYDGRTLEGEVKHGDATIRFVLAITPRDLTPFVPFPYPAMYRAPFPKSKTVSPILDAVADGEVEILTPTSVRSWKVEKWPAMQGHNWGTRHADTYAWAHCNAWREPEGRDVVFEGFSGKVRLGKVRLGTELTTPLVTVVGVRYRGVRYEARALGEILRGKGSIENLRRWTFFAKQAGATIEGTFTLRDEDIVGLYYPNPDGEMTYCLNSKLARATLRFAPHDRAPLVLTSDAAALEIGTHDAAHGARMYV